MNKYINNIIIFIIIITTNAIIISAINGLSTDYNKLLY